MTSTERYFAGVSAVVLLSLLSWLTIAPGTPRIYAPFNLLVWLPAAHASNLFDGSHIIAAIVVVPSFFCLWSWPVLRGRHTLPTRSVVLLILAVILSATWLFYDFPASFEYQSVNYVIGVAIVNVVCWLALGALALLACRRPSVTHNLGFHVALFAWLAWCAFPYLGEFQ